MTTLPAFQNAIAQPAPSVLQDSGDRQVFRTQPAGANTVRRRPLAASRTRGLWWGVLIGTVAAWSIVLAVIWPTHPGW